MSVDLIDLHPTPDDLQQVVEEGLRKSPRQLPAWLLYDAAGSQLFEEICAQPEYTLTRTELSLLQDRAKEIAVSLGSGVIVEFGIGNTRKVAPLLQTIQPSSFIALDISRAALEGALRALDDAHPGINMLGICCDHSTLPALPAHPWLDSQRRIGFFPGSSLGNFQPKDAVALLARFRQLLDGGPLLLGLDQPRDPAQLEAAYDDAAGVSAAFARNLLHRLNRDLNGSIKPERFDYRARWQEAEQRIEMALISRCEQTLLLANSRWRFASGEPLITEHSLKYSPQAAAELAAQAGWRIRRRWHDPNDTLSLHWLEPSD